MKFTKFNMKRVLLILTVASLMIFATQPFVASAQTAAGAAAEDGGIAAARATSIFGWTTATAASIGNAQAGALAVSPVSAAGAAVATNGPAAAWAQGIGTPFFSQSNAFAVAAPGGAAQATSFAFP